MKKKILALCLVVVLAVTAVTGATLAYFTDTDEQTNTFTMGGVEIDLIEKEYEDDKLVDFNDDNNAPLMPGKENKQDKIVSIKNTGKSDAYVWYEWYIPTALDSTAGDLGTTNVLHVNSYGATWDKYYGKGYTLPADQKAPANENETWDHDPEVETKIAVGPEGYIRQETVDGIQYNVYLVLYKDVLSSEESTTPAMNGVYLDADLKYDGTKYTCHGKTVDYDFTKDMDIIVKAYGIQAELADKNGDGDVDVYDAYLTYKAEA